MINQAQRKQIWNLKTTKYKVILGIKNILGGRINCRVDTEDVMVVMNNLIQNENKELTRRIFL